MDADVTDKYYAQYVHYAHGPKWRVMHRASAGGDRVVADRMGERYARRIARLLNDDESAHAIYERMNDDLAPTS